MDADKKRTELETLISQCSDLAKKRDQELSELREALQAGKIKSNDPVKDFVTVYLGDWSSEIIQPYQRLVNQTQENIGNEILILKQDSQEYDPVMYLEFQGELGFMPPIKEYQKKLDLTFGRLTRGLELDIKTGNLIFPSKKHVKARVSFLDFGDKDVLTELDWKTSEDSIKEQYYDLPHLHEFIKKDPMYSLWSFTNLSPHNENSRILFGKEVVDYFENCVEGQKAYSEAKRLIE